MTTEELVQRITAEVLKQLRQEPAGSPAPAPPPPTGPKVLLLYTGGCQGLDEAVAVATDLAAAGAQLKLLCTPSARPILGEVRLQRLAAAGELLEEQGGLAIYRAVHWAQTVAVPILTQNTAVKAALGICDSMASNLLAAAIMMHRKVVICPDSAVPHGGPARYRAMLTGYIDQLRAFGAESVSLAEMVRACLGEQKAPPSPAPEASPPRRLIAAAEVEQAIRQGQQQLSVPRGTIVTPLARDLCREHTIALIGLDGREADAAR